MSHILFARHECKTLYMIGCMSKCTTIHLALGLATLLAVGCSTQSRDAAAGEQNVPPLVIDVRTLGEFESGHIDGAMHIPYEDIAVRIEELTTDKDRAIVLYCRSGRRSGIARETLIGLGFTDVENAGGIEEYREALGQ